LYSPQNIISIIKPKRIRWAEHAALVEEMINAYKILVRKAEEKLSLIS
jgi:hypothetical protein